MIKIGIIDDHTVVRSGLRDYLDSQPDLKVVGEGASGRDALALVRSQPVDVLLMDLCMPGQNGMDALADVLSQAGAARADPERLPGILVCAECAQARRLGIPEQEVRA